MATDVKGRGSGRTARAARRGPAWPAPRLSRPRGPCSSNAATPQRRSRPSATLRTSRPRPCTGCSPPSSGSSRHCSMSQSPVTTRQRPCRIGPTPVRFLPTRIRSGSCRGSPASAARSITVGTGLPDPPQRLRLRSRGGGAARRVHATAARGPRADRPVPGPFWRAAAGAETARRRRHHPRAHVPRGLPAARR